jgi:hypothetical protein
MNAYASILAGNDLRSIGKSNRVVNAIKNQPDFDDLFDCLFNKDRVVVMRSADAIEKITKGHPEYLVSHKAALYRLLKEAVHKELKWHIALLITRVPLSKIEIQQTVKILTTWAFDPKESRIVRVNALQGLFDLSNQYPKIRQKVLTVIDSLKRQNIPSMNARIRKLVK